MVLHISFFQRTSQQKKVTRSCGFFLVHIQLCLCDLWLCKKKNYFCSFIYEEHVRVLVVKSGSKGRVYYFLGSLGFYWAFFLGLYWGYSPLPLGFNFQINPNSSLVYVLQVMKIQQCQRQTNVIMWHFSAAFKLEMT